MKLTKEEKAAQKATTAWHEKVERYKKQVNREWNAIVVTKAMDVLNLRKFFNREQEAELVYEVLSRVETTRDKYVAVLGWMEQRLADFRQELSSRSNAYCSVAELDQVRGAYWAAVETAQLVCHAMNVHSPMLVREYEETHRANRMRYQVERRMEGTWQIQDLVTLAVVELDGHATLYKTEDDAWAAHAALCGELLF